MIGWLRGTLRRKALPAVVLDAGGIGYELHVSLSTYERLPEPGEETVLEVQTLLRTESLQLYGFATLEEKRLFNVLLGVSGVGPRLALSLLSTLPPHELLEAVEHQRAAVLERVPGIGRKTAQRLLLELRDRIAAMPDVSAGGRPAAAPAPAEPAASGDAVAALENLGYRRREAEQAVQQALRESPDLELAVLLREALRRLGAS